MSKLLDKQTVIDHISAAQRGIPDNGIRTRALKDGLDIAKREVERESSFDDMIVLDRITKAYHINFVEKFTLEDALSHASSVETTMKVVGLYDKYKAFSKLVNHHWVVTFQLR